MMKFLTIDNQPLIQFGLKNLIEQQFPGAEIQQVADKDAAWAVLQSGCCDLIFLGVHDDEQDAVAWVGSARERCPHTKIIIYLSFEEEETEMAYRNVGADEVLSFREGREGMSGRFKALLESSYIIPRHH